MGKVGAEAEDATGVLRKLNQERRQMHRLQMVAKAAGEGEAKTMDLLATAFLRTRGRSAEVRSAFQTQNKEMVESIIKGRGLTGIQATLFRAMAQTHLAVGRFGAAIGRVQEAISPFTSAASKGFAIITASVLGLVTAGLAGTQQGNALALRFKLIAREIAGIFLPVVNKLLDVLEQVYTWFHNLTGAGQRWIMNLTLGTAAALGAVSAIGILLGAIVAAAAGIQAAIAAIGLTATIATGGISLVLGVLAAGFAALAVGTDGGRSSLQSFYDVFAALFGLFKPVLAIFGEVAGMISGRLGAAFATFAGWVKRLWTSIADQLGPALVEWARAGQRAWEQILGLFGDLSDLVADLWSLFGDLGTLLKDVFVGTLQLALRIITGMVGAIAEAVHQMRVVMALAANPGGGWDEAERTVDLEDKRRKMLDRERAKEGDQGHQIPVTAGKGFEGIADTFRRIQNAAASTDWDKQTADATKETAKNTRMLVLQKGAGQPEIQPAVGP